MSGFEYSQSIPRGSPIFREGEPGDSAYVILSGRVEISALRKGTNVSIATLAEDDFFGEMALIDSRPRSATATALEDTELIVIRREQLRDRMAKTDPLLNHFLRVVLERFRASQNMLMGHEPDIELAGFLDESAEQTEEYERDRRRAIRELELEQELYRGLNGNEFELHFQPIVDLDSGRTAGFEALIRWRHPEQGVLSPGHFIAVAEESGVIVPLGLWVLEDACRSLALFQDTYKTHRPDAPSLFMNVNVSGCQLADPGLIGEFLSVFDVTGVDPTRIKLEITESVLLENPDKTADTLLALKKLGVKLALDDFGTGYSSLSYLHRFPIDNRQDRPFIRRHVVEGKWQHANSPGNRRARPQPGHGSRG